MELYFLVKTLHIISSTILFGFGCGTAWYFWNAHLSGNPATIAHVGRMVVRADWIFTGISGLVQPASGLWLIHLTGYSLTEPWLILSYALYALAFLCWAPVVWLQIEATRLAEKADRDGSAPGPEYHRKIRLWFALGWPAFIGLVCVFWLMVARPALW